MFWILIDLVIGLIWRLDSICKPDDVDKTWNYYWDCQEQKHTIDNDIEGVVVT